MSASDLDSRNIAISMRKSVENLVISSQDAIGQSISQALNFSGVMSPHSNQGNQMVHETRSVSRSPSPSLRNSECGDSAALAESSCSKSLEVSVSGERSDSASVAGDVVILRDPKEYFRQSSTPVGGRAGADPARNQKKKSWYNALYPTYKTKSEDFKRLFKELPDEERLIVDYSCALQKDILAQGRLYASPSFLCFHASIFGWETSLCLRWKDVTAITKEKTALVIPNAILVCTETEKHFLTSFHGRDKSYLMLFRIWQNALMDQPVSSRSIWQWVHTCYGEELGFNSDDEGYPRDLFDDPSLPVPLPVELGEAMEARGADKDDQISTRSSHGHDSTPPPVTNGGGRFAAAEGDALPTDQSDSSDSDQDKPHSAGSVEKCSIHHEWRQFLRQEVPFNVDQLFTMIFTNSKFNLEILALRNITDYVQAPWAGVGGQRCRQVSYTAALTTGPIGPKEVHVTETQVMNKCSKPGVQYSIESRGENAGIPYADYFSVDMHYCLRRAGQHCTELSLYGVVSYKKAPWPVVKSFLEKNAMSGVEEFVRILSSRLAAEADAAPPRPRRRRRTHGAVETVPAKAPLVARRASAPRAPAAAPAPRWLLLTLLLLVTVNGLLYYRLYCERTYIDIDHLQNRMGAGGAEGAGEWARLLEQASRRQRHQLAAWRHALDHSRRHLAQTEQALSNLLEMIKPTLEKAQTEPKSEHNEL